MRVTSHTQLNEPFLEHILSEMRYKEAIPYIERGSILADLGCGYQGNFLKRISGMIKLGVGYDVSVKSKNIPKNITLKASNLNKQIDNKKNYYDIITTLAVLEHLENPESFLLKVKAMLKIGGKVVITTPHRKSKPILEFFSLKVGVISKDEVKDHKNYFDEKTLGRLLTKTGFKIVKLHTFEFGWNLFCIGQKIS
jgi:2-polyprenyl-3-methyl-5-hydroxy-6-metoxy-1,4-benzoquinol methylase